MADDLSELKRKLVEATRRFEDAGDIEEKALIGADVRELERLAEIAAANDPDKPKDPTLAPEPGVGQIAP